MISLDLGVEHIQLGLQGGDFIVSNHQYQATTTFARSVGAAVRALVFMFLNYWMGLL
jgi:hypothetical protein